MTHFHKEQVCQLPAALKHALLKTRIKIRLMISYSILFMCYSTFVPLLIQSCFVTQHLPAQLLLMPHIIIRQAWLYFWPYVALHQLDIPSRQGENYLQAKEMRQSWGWRACYLNIKDRAEMWTAVFSIPAARASFKYFGRCIELIRQRGNLLHWKARLELLLAQEYE